MSNEINKENDGFAGSISAKSGTKGNLIIRTDFVKDKMWDEAKEILAGLFDPDDIIMLEVIWPKERIEEGLKCGLIWMPEVSEEFPNPKAATVPKKYRKFLCLKEINDAVFNYYKDLNDLGFGVYFGIGPRIDKESKDGTAENVKHFTYFAADYDAKDFFNKNELSKFTLEFLKELIKKGNFPNPRYIIKTGGGFHCYWPIDQKLPPKVWQSLQKRVNLTLGADPNTNKISGVLRLPGYKNTKLKDSLRDVALLTEETSPIQLFRLKDLEAKLLPGNEWESPEDIKDSEKYYKRASLFDWGPFKIQGQFNEERIRFTKHPSDKKEIVIECWNHERHNEGTDKDPSQNVCVEGSKKGCVNCRHCEQGHGDVLDVILAYRQEKNSGAARTRLIDELSKEYPGWYLGKDAEYHTPDSPIRKIRTLISNFREATEDERNEKATNTYIGDCPLCDDDKNDENLYISEFDHKSSVTVIMQCQKKCNLLKILNKIGLEPNELEIKKPVEKVHLKSKLNEAKEKYSGDDALPLFYSKEDGLQILDHLLELEYNCDCLKYFPEKKGGDFWDFNQATNEWTKCDDLHPKNKLMYLLDRCFQPDGKKKYLITNPILNSLVGMLKAHNWTKAKNEKGKGGYNFSPVPNEKELGIDDELLIPHRNGNLWVELKPPYRRILYPATPNHFHRSTRPWDYKEYKFIKYENGFGYFERATNLGEVTDEDEIGKIVTSSLQPKIHYDWFQGGEDDKGVDDPGGRTLFYEIGGYADVQKNKEKKVFYWLLESDAGKMVAMFQITWNIGEDNCWSTKIKKAGSRFGQIKWVGARLVIYTDVKQDPKNEYYMIEVGQQVAEISGGDIANVEGKGTNEENERTENHFIFVANETIKMPDQQGEQRNRAIFLPFEHNVVADPNIKTDRYLTEKLQNVQECQIFENLCLDADLARRKRGGEFSHSCFEAKHIKSFIRKGDDWVRFVEDTMEPVSLKGFEKLSPKEKGEIGVFTNLIVSRAVIWFQDNKNIKLDLTSTDIGRRVGSALRKLEWKNKKSKARRDVILSGGKKENIPCGIRYGLKMKNHDDPANSPGIAGAPAEM